MLPRPPWRAARHPAPILGAMPTVDDALHAARRTPPRPAVAGPRRIVVAGGGGALGAALVEQLLAGRRFAEVGVLVTRPLDTAMRGMLPLRCDAHTFALTGPPGAVADTAAIVFDRERHANGREAAFLRPAPSALPALAAALHARGARRLLVVMPHAPSGLPEALKHGLATLDEQAVSAIGFDQLLFVRSAQMPPARRGDGFAQRLAHGVLAQLRIMVPQPDQPVRAAKVARFAAELAARLPDAPPGTRVVPPEVVWQSAQPGDVGALAAAWLAGRALREAAAVPPRM